MPDADAIPTDVPAPSPAAAPPATDPQPANPDRDDQDPPGDDDDLTAGAAGLATTRAALVEVPPAEGA